MEAYLDNAAATRLDPRVREAMLAALDLYGNPSSPHAPGRAARKALEDAREELAAVVGCSPLEVVFTSGATEANNLAILGTEGPAAVSAIEHESVIQPAFSRPGTAVLPVGPDGIARAVLPEGIRLVSLMLVNNEVGTLQPVAEIARIARARGVLVHCDAAQALGKVPFRFRELGVDLLSLSSHKIHGPRGAGALIVRDGVDVRALLRGGEHEQGRRAGTENVAAIVGFARAATLAAENFDRNVAHMRRLRDRWEEELLRRLPGIRINGDPGRRAPHISNLQFEGVEGELLLFALDQAGGYASAGSACASLGVDPSHTLTAMGLDPVSVQSSLRFSFASDTTDEEVEAALDQVVATVTRLRKQGRREDPRRPGSGEG